MSGSMNQCWKSVGSAKPFTKRLATAGIWLAAPMISSTCGGGGCSIAFVQFVTCCA